MNGRVHLAAVEHTTTPAVRGGSRGKRRGVSGTSWRRGESPVDAHIDGGASSTGAADMQSQTQVYNQDETDAGKLDATEADTSDKPNAKKQSATNAGKRSKTNVDAPEAGKVGETEADALKAGKVGETEADALKAGKVGETETDALKAGKVGETETDAPEAGKLDETEADEPEAAKLSETEADKLDETEADAPDPGKVDEDGVDELDSTEAGNLMQADGGTDEELRQDKGKGVVDRRVKQRPDIAPLHSGEQHGQADEGMAPDGSDDEHDSADSRARKRKSHKSASPEPVLKQAKKNKILITVANGVYLSLHHMSLCILAPAVRSRSSCTPTLYTRSTSKNIKGSGKLV